jgi:hypothetical protein
MSVIKLTDKVANNTAAPTTSRYLELWDTEEQGFGLRVMQSGVKSWFVHYRVSGRKRMVTLGRKIVPNVFGVGSERK